jgi:hypothetical protein
MHQMHKYNLNFINKLNKTTIKVGMILLLYKGVALAMKDTPQQVLAIRMAISIYHILSLAHILFVVKELDMRLH